MTSHGNVESFGSSTLIAQPATSLRRAQSARWHRCALVLLLAAAAWFRFAGITSVGVRFDDENLYVRDARLWHACAALAMDTQAWRALWQADKIVLKQRVKTIGVDFKARYAKLCQGYTFLGAVMMFPFGDGPAALLLLNALCGTLSVWVLYALGNILYGRFVGLSAALLLAISPFHLLYCRGLWPYATSGLFVLIAVLFWSRGRLGRKPERRAYFLSGLALGYACLCHYSSATVIGALLLTDIVAPRPITSTGATVSDSQLGMMSRWKWMICGVFVPVLFVECLFELVRLGPRLVNGSIPLMTLLESFGYWAEVIIRCGVRAPGAGLMNGAIPGIYAGYFVHWHGLTAGLLVLVGLYVSFRAIGPAKIPAFVITLFVGLLMFQRYTISRAIATAIPFTILCIAAAVYAMVGYGSHFQRLKRTLAVIVLLVLAIPAAAQSWTLLGKRSQLADACAFIQARGGGSVVLPLDSGVYSKYQLYLEDDNTTVIRENFHWTGPPEQVLVDLRRQGARWMITDPQCWHYHDRSRPLSEEVFTWWQAMNEELSQRAKLVAEFPHIINGRWEFLTEGPGLWALPEMTLTGDGPVRIYDLEAKPSTMLAKHK